MQRARFVQQVRCDAGSQNTPKKPLFPLLNTPSAKKRNVSIKENINKLIAIGTSEVKEFNELMKEFDIAHKKALDVLKSNSSSESSSTPSTEETDNIFLD